MDDIYLIDPDLNIPDPEADELPIEERTLTPAETEELSGEDICTAGPSGLTSHKLVTAQQGLTCTGGFITASSQGIKFSDNSIQTTAALGSEYFNWVSKTSSFNAEYNRRYVVYGDDITTNVIVTLPPSSQNAAVYIAVDYSLGSSFKIVPSNSDTIDGSAFSIIDSSVISNRDIIVLIAQTGNWRIYDIGSGTGGGGGGGGTGLIGATGFTGATGPSGSKASIYTNHTPPSPATPGDLWWNTETGNLNIYYGDIDSSQWVSAVSMIGVNGATGFTGATGAIGTKASLVAGTAPPSPALNGDLWWDTETGNLKVYYIDEDNTEQWVSAVSMIGFYGATGPIGFTGATGFNGYDGATGPIGFTGATGSINFTASDKEIIYNSSGNATGATGFIYDASTDRVGIDNYSPSYKLDVTGDIRATGTIYSTHFDNVSDLSLKINVNSLTNSLEVINSLNPVSFIWKKTNKKSYGLIAQEVEKILPDIVTYQKSDDIKTVSYLQLIPFLISAIQELQKEVNDLKKQA